MNYRIAANQVVAKEQVIKQKLTTMYIDILKLDGGFGNKETRCDIPYAAVTVAANKYYTLYQYSNLVLNLESCCY